MGRHHTGAPGHPPPLDHRAHHNLGTTDGPPPPPPHRPKGLQNHTNGRRPRNSSPRPRGQHTPASIVGTYGGTPRPHPMASHRHHLPHPRRPHTHLAATVGGHLGGPSPRTPRVHAHPPHPTPDTRSRPSTTGHTHPGIMDVRHTQKTHKQRRTSRPPYRSSKPRPRPRTATPNEATPFGGHTKTTTPSPPNQAPPPQTPTQPPSSKPQQRQPHR